MNFIQILQLSYECYQSQQESIVYNNITQFQQMATIPKITLSIMLRSIKHILKQFQQRHKNNAMNLHISISKLTKQLHSSQICSQNIISLMISSEETEELLKQILWAELLKSKKQEQIMQEYYYLKKQIHQKYIIANNGLNILIKEILENIKLIEDQLTKLSHNLIEIKKNTSKINYSKKLSEISLYYLLRIVMDDTRIEFTQSLNQLLFRMYILEESINLIFIKTSKVFEDIYDQMNQEKDCLRHSISSQNTVKKSALSQSLQIFKKSQLKRELIQNQFLNSQGNILGGKIQSDYKMSRNQQKKLLKKQKKGICCFAF